MTEETVQTIRVIYHHAPEGWWADSPDVQGWSAAGSSYEEVRGLAEDGVRFALDSADVELEHFVPADDSAVAVST